jgi:integrase
MTECAPACPDASAKPVKVGRRAVLQGIFLCAVTWGHLQSNPVVGVRKPSAKRQRAVVPPSLAVIERMRALLLAERRRRDATLVAVLAYAGLRPREALALPWQNVRDRTLLIDRAQLKGTKTGRTRSVRLLAPLGVDLAALTGK